MWQNWSPTHVFNFFPKHSILHGWLAAFHLHKVSVTSKLKKKKTKNKKKGILTKNLSLQNLETPHKFAICKMVKNMEKTNLKIIQLSVSFL